MGDVLTRFRTKREPEKVPPAPRQHAKKPPFAPVPLDEAAPYFRAIDGGSGAVVVVLLALLPWLLGRWLTFAVALIESIPERL